MLTHCGYNAALGTIDVEGYLADPVGTMSAVAMGAPHSAVDTRV